jgi:hypothetical protein
MWKKVSEQRQQNGSWVVYECTNDVCGSHTRGGKRFQEKVFEEY